MSTVIPTSNAKLGSYLEALGRRRRMFVLVFSLILLIGSLVALLLPAVYSSRAVILIEQQAIPSELVRSTITSFADQRIQVISQRVMTSQNLSQIVEKYDLYREEKKTETTAQIITKMRDDISLEMISADVVDPRTGRPTEATIAFEIKYRSKNPTLAQRVANELVSLYLNENIKTRNEIAADTATFLTEEASRLATTVGDLETRLAEFKGQHVESRPELEDVTRSLMNRTDLEIAEIDRQASSAAQQKIHLEGELARLRPYRAVDLSGGGTPLARLQLMESELAAAEARYAGSHPDVVRLRKEVEALRADADPAAARQVLKQQLVEARSRLTNALEQYASEHPDVATAEREVALITKKLEAIPADAEPVPDNPLFTSTKARLDAVNAELDSLVAKRALLSQKYEHALQNLMKMPDAEAEYRAINREYETAVAKYREVTAKQMEAKMSESLEAERKGERFTLIEPPALPEEPAEPNRWAIGTLSFVMAVIGGFGFVGVAEATDTRIRGRRDIQELLTAPPLATIPVVLNGTETSAAKKKMTLLAAAAIVILVAAMTIHFVVKPLDVAWFMALRKLGL